MVVEIPRKTVERSFPYLLYNTERSYTIATS